MSDFWFEVPLPSISFKFPFNSYTFLPLKKLSAVHSFAHDFFLFNFDSITRTI